MISITLSENYLAKIQLTNLDLQESPITDWSPVAHVETVNGRP
ncbi:MAG: hypothetical protein RR234_06800 [Christensenella sp.]